MRTITVLIMIVACTLPSTPVERIKGNPVPVLIVPTEDCPDVTWCDK